MGAGTDGYDIIGDLHGQAGPLKELLEKLGYYQVDGVYRHQNRQAIFVGDLVDRGPNQREVVDLVRTMVEAETALICLGNHEFNAIAYATRHPKTGEFLRPHSEKNRGQHQAFLEAYAGDESGYCAALDWFKSLPLWIDLGDLRVIHACWDQEWIDRITSEYPDAPRVPDSFWTAAGEKGTWQYDAVETLLKGKEVSLPQGHVYHDKEGNARHNIRVRWWDETATSFRDAYMGPKSAITHIPDDDIQGEHLLEYSHKAPPVILGHYWLEGRPEPLAANIGCVDYSIAKPGGQLVAYRWSGEAELTQGNYCAVDG